MNLFKTINLFNWKKPELSEFYLATIFSFFVFQLTEGMVIQIARWFIAGLKTTLTYQPSDDQLWFCLVFVTFVITMLLMIFLVRPMGLRVDKQAETPWELILTFILVFGFFIYVNNNIFRDVALPSSLPQWVIKLFDGWENTYGTASPGQVFDRNFWSVVPWLWILGPMLVFYFPIFKVSIGNKEIK